MSKYTVSSDLNDKTHIVNQKAYICFSHRSWKSALGKVMDNMSGFLLYMWWFYVVHVVSTPCLNSSPANEDYYQ